MVSMGQSEKNISRHLAASCEKFLQLISIILEKNYKPCIYFYETFSKPRLLVSKLLKLLSFPESLLLLQLRAFWKIKGQIITHNPMIL